MDQLIKIKDSFINYLSPPSKRRRTINPATPDGREHTYVTSYSDPQDRRAQTTEIPRLNTTYFPNTSNPRKRGRDDEDSITFSPVDPDDSISQIIPMDEDSKISDITLVTAESESEEVDRDSLEEESEDGADMMEVEEVDSQDKVAEYLARQAELETRLKDVEAFKLSGKHPDEIFLFERMSMRGFEQLLPASWQVDFPTLPVDIFTKDREKTFIRENCISSSRAVKALQSLLTLGVRVRDNVSTGGPTERLIAKEIRSYMKWARRDGGFDQLRFIPVLAVVTARVGQSIEAISAELTRQMRFLAKKHRKHLAAQPSGYINDLGEVEMYSRPPPLLYGMVVAQTLVIFFTFDSADPDATIRHLTHSQFMDKEMDAWNEFAIALTIIVARNYMMSIKDQLRREDEISDPDPDA